MLAGWRGRSIYDFLSNLQAIMPMHAPGSLSMQEYTDVVAYMLELNSIPAGEAELSSDEGALRQIQIEYRR